MVVNAASLIIVTYSHPPPIDEDLWCRVAWDYSCKVVPQDSAVKYFLMSSSGAQADAPPTDARWATATIVSRTDASTDVGTGLSGARVGACRLARVLGVPDMWCDGAKAGRDEGVVAG